MNDYLLAFSVISLLVLHVINSSKIGELSRRIDLLEDRS